MKLMKKIIYDEGKNMMIINFEVFMKVPDVGEGWVKILYIECFCQTQLRLIFLQNEIKGQHVVFLKSRNLDVFGFYVR